MKMEIGPQIKKSAILKYKARLEGLLAEHEYQAGQLAHLTLLVKIQHDIEQQIKKYTDKKSSDV